MVSSALKGESKYMDNETLVNYAEAMGLEWIYQDSFDTELESGERTREFWLTRGDESMNFTIMHMQWINENGFLLEKFQIYEHTTPLNQSYTTLKEAKISVYNILYWRDYFYRPIDN